MATPSLVVSYDTYSYCLIHDYKQPQVKGTETVQMRMQGGAVVPCSRASPRSHAGYPSKAVVDLVKLLGNHRSAAVRSRFINDD